MPYETKGQGRVAPSVDRHGSDTVLVLRWSRVTQKWEDWCRCSVAQAQAAVRTDRVPSMDKTDKFRLVDWISKRDVDPFLPTD